MWICKNWSDFEVLDAANGEKLERWGSVVLQRPDPQVIWKKRSAPHLWTKADAIYHRSATGGGNWEVLSGNMPQKWSIRYGASSFNIKPMGFKHTGLFPEQAANWDWFSSKIKNAGRPISVLNLFAYTGGATVAAASAGASVCHVDAAKGMVSWAKENVELSGLGNVRYIVDDVVKFVSREIKRGKKYDAVIMDPPSYGRGPGGEMWKIEDEIYSLAELCVSVLSENPLFFLINSYTTGLAPQVMGNILTLTVKEKFGGIVESGEVGLPISSGGIILPCGASGRWSRD